MHFSLSDFSYTLGAAVAGVFGSLLVFLRRKDNRASRRLAEAQAEESGVRMLSTINDDLRAEIDRMRSSLSDLRVEVRRLRTEVVDLRRDNSTLRRALQQNGIRVPDRGGVAVKSEPKTEAH